MDALLFVLYLSICNCSSVLVNSCLSVQRPAGVAAVTCGPSSGGGRRVSQRRSQASSSPSGRQTRFVVCASSCDRLLHRTTPVSGVVSNDTVSTAGVKIYYVWKIMLCNEACGCLAEM